MTGRGRPRALQYDWLITFLFVGSALISFYQANILGAYVVDLGVAALVVGLLYAFFKKHLSFFGSFTPWMYLFLGLGVFWLGSYGGLGSSFGNIFQSLNSSHLSIIPLAVVNGTSIDAVSWGLLSLGVLAIFLVAFELQYTDFEGF